MYKFLKWIKILFYYENFQMHIEIKRMIKWTSMFLQPSFSKDQHSILPLLFHWFSLFSVDRWLDWLIEHPTAFHPETHCIWLSESSIGKIHQKFLTVPSIFISLSNFHLRILRFITLSPRYIILLLQNMTKGDSLVLSFLLHLLALILT